MNYESICAQFRSMFGAYLDDELPLEDTERVKRHLKSCIGCALEFEQLKSLQAIIKAPIIDEPDEEFWEEQRRQIASAINIRLSRTKERSRIIQIPVSFAIKTALGIAAAAAIVFLIISKTGNNNSKIAYFNELPVQETPVLSKPQKPELPELSKEYTVQKPIAEQKIPSESNIKKPKSVIARDKPLSEKEKIASTEIISTVAQQESAKFIGEKTIPTVKPVQKISEPIKVSPPSKSQVKATAQQFLKSGASSAETSFEESVSNLSLDYRLYLQKQEEITNVKDLIWQKNQWKSLLRTTNDKVVGNLVIYDIYQIYCKLMMSSPDLVLKKEAVDFITTHKIELIVILGTKGYEERLEQFKRIEE